MQLHQPRNVREKRFTYVIHSTISQGGCVLIPAFALGRTQELLLILDEYWSNHPELHNIPIISQRITIAYTGAFGVLKHRLKQIFESVESLPDEESEGPAFRVHERLTVKYESEKYISLHWRSDPISDMVSDSVMALVLNISREIPMVVVESEEAIKTKEENSKKAEKVVLALLVSLLRDGDKCRWKCGAS